MMRLTGLERQHPPPPHPSLKTTMSDLDTSKQKKCNIQLSSESESESESKFRSILHLEGWVIVLALSEVRVFELLGVGER